MALALAFSKIIRDAVVKTQATVTRYVKDIILAPVQKGPWGKKYGQDEVDTKDMRPLREEKRYPLERTEDGWPISIAGSF